jgi:hypothetical protein
MHSAITYLYGILYLSRQRKVAWSSGVPIITANGIWLSFHVVPKAVKCHTVRAADARPCLTAGGAAQRAARDETRCLSDLPVFSAR